MPFVRRCSLLAGALVAVALVAACDPPDSVPVPGTVGTLAVDAPDTLLPVLVEVEATFLPEEITAPPGALFGGDLCAALTTADLEAVTFAGLGRGTVVGDPFIATDGCAYTVDAGDEQVAVTVTARSQADFARPSDDAAAIDEIDGIGEAARGVERENGYEVYVKVDNGWFSVRSADRSSALALARRATPRAAQG